MGLMGLQRNCDRYLLSQPPQQENKPCTLFTEYHPKPGGQTQIWTELLPFGDEERSHPIDPGYRGLYVRGGRGGGKSHIGAAIACTRAYHDPESRGLISANDYPQLETSTLVALAEFCEQFSIPLSPQADTPEETARMIARRKLCKIFDAQVLVIAATKFGGETVKAKQSGRGMQVRWAWLDEWAFADKAALNTLNAALGRGNGSLKGFFAITSTINANMPYNWCWEMFDDDERSPELRELYRSVNLLSSDNDSLDVNFVKTLEASYTPELRAIELRGEYATASGDLLFNHFDRTKHCKAQQLDPELPVHLSFDFNRSPATAIAAQEQNGAIVILREWFRLNSDTFDLSDAVASWVKALPIPIAYLHGDASGQSLTANSKQSNWTIVLNAMQQAGIAVSRRYGATNPSITDSIASCNCALMAGLVAIDPACKELVKDLEFLKGDGRGGIDKKADPMRSHVGDCFRYLVHDLKPFKRPSGRSLVGGDVRAPLAQTQRKTAR